jgi:hypothetical protein
MFSTSTLIRQIRNEYQTMPGLKLTREQACRLWAVNVETCDEAIAMLVEEGFLHNTGTGKYIALPSRTKSVARVENLETRTTSVRCPHCQKLNTMEQGTFRCAGCRRIITFSAISA